MIRWSVIAVFSLFLWSSPPVMAQGVAVQSGEHDGFTRLVIPIGVDRAWNISQQEEGVSVQFTPDLLGLDVSAVYRTVPRTRLANVSFNGSQLELTLGCQCDIADFRYRDQYLVIDVSDPAAQAQSTPVVLPTIFDRPTSQAALDLPQPSDSSAPDPYAEATARIIAEQIARSASAGLLDAAAGGSMQFGDPRALLQGNPTALAPASSDLEEGLPITVGNGFDLSTANPPPGIAGLGGCPIEENFDFLTHGNSGAFHAEYTSIHANLFDDRDQLDTASASDLAYLYLAHGLGTEAIYWLEKARSSPAGLLALAAYFDGSDQPQFPAVSDHDSCSGMALLWRIATTDQVLSLSDIQAATILQAFFSLSNRIQALVGADLAGALSQLGHDRIAQDVQIQLERSPVFSRSEEILLEFDIGSNTASDIAERLDSIPQNEAALSVEALSRRLALSRDRQEPVPSHLLTAAEALVREAGLASQDALWRELVFAHGISGEITTAIAMIASQHPNDGVLQSVVDQMLSDVAASGLVARALFLEASLENAFPIENAARETRINLALLYRDADLPSEYERLVGALSGRLPQALRAQGGPQTPSAIAVSTSPAISPDIAATSRSMSDISIDGMTTAIGASRSFRASVSEILTDPPFPLGN